MKSIRIILWVFLSALSLTCLGQKKNVLIIHSYHQGLEWTDDITKAIEDVFADCRDSVDLSFEFMDTKKYEDTLKYSKYYNETLPETYAMKYGDNASVIIVSDNAAFDFIKKNRDRIAPGVPVVFCGVNDFRPEMIQGVPEITGITENVDYVGNIKLILNLHPNLDSIIVINDNKSLTSKIHKKLFSEAVSENFPNVKFVYWEDVLIDEIDQWSASLGNNTAIFLINFHKDKANQFIDYPELAYKASHHNKAPVYAPFTFFFGKGIVGGLLTGGYLQGESAAQIAKRILKGESADAIPVIMESPTQYMFDYTKLQLFHIDLSQLPSDSKLINHDPAVEQFVASRKDYAVLFACDEYDDPLWKRLNNPIKDAQAIAYELETRYGFQVDVVENPTLDSVALKIKQYAKKTYGPEDQILFFFSGHGYFDELEKEGYIVLKNSIYGELSNASYYGYAKLTSQLSSYSCNHVFLVLDNCYSGTVFKDIAMAPPNKSDGAATNQIDQSTTKDWAMIKEVLKYRTRKALTAGGKVEVSDGIIHSPLTMRLLEALRSNGGSNQVLTIDEIKQYCEEQPPFPKIGDFSDTAEPGSDFLFIAK